MVTLEELGVLSSDLLMFRCFIVFFGFCCSLSLWFLGVTLCGAAAPRGDGVFTAWVELEIVSTRCGDFGVDTGTGHRALLSGDRTQGRAGTVLGEV